MKKVISVLLLVVLFSLCGCVNYGKFYLMSQNDKRSYVKQELKSLYNIDCDISEIRKKEISMYENEEYYSGTASLNKNRWFPFWVDNYGNIKDTYFCVELSSSIDRYFSSYTNKYFSSDEFCLYTNTIFNTPPSKTWEIKDDLREMYKSEDITTNMFLFLKKDMVIDEDVFKRIKKDLSGYKGYLKVYYCDDVNVVVFDNWDLSKHDYFLEI